MTAAAAEATGGRSLETARTRLVAGAALFALGFAVIGARLVDVTVLRADPEAGAPRSGTVPHTPQAHAAARRHRGP